MAVQSKTIAKRSFPDIQGANQLGYYLITCLILIVYFIILLPIRYENYVVAGDEPAFLVASIWTSPWQWFISGYSHYFDVYPEWFTPYTNFIRPTTNAFAWVLHHIFGNHFEYYLFSYNIFVLISTFLVLRCLNEMFVKGPVLIFVSIIWPLSPAVVSQGLWSIPFIFDVVAALFVLVAFRAVVHERYILAVTALTLAVGAKETAIFAPVAAALTILSTRRISFRVMAVSALMLLPLIAWIAMRRFSFGPFLGGTYRAIGFHSVIRGLEAGAVGINSIASIQTLLSTGNIVNSKQLVDILSFLVNVLLWITILGIYYLRLFPLILSIRSKKSENVVEADRFLLATMIWFAGAISFVVLYGLTDRYDACEYVFLLLLLITNAEFDRQSLIGRLTVLSLFALVLLYLPIAFNELMSVRLRGKMETKLQASLDDVLAKIGGPSRKILVVNAPSGFSAPKSIGQLLKSTNELVFLNQFDGCAGAPGFFGAPVSTEKGLHIEIPDCATLIWDGAIDRQFAFDKVNTVNRPGIGVYVFADAKVLPSFITVKLEGKEFYFRSASLLTDLIYYNWNDQAYEHLTLSN